MAGACTMLLVESTLSSSGLDPLVLTKLLIVFGLAGSVAYAIRLCKFVSIRARHSRLRAGSFEMWYRRHYAREYAREKWELENYEKGEKEEMVGLFTHKGLNRNDAESVIETMSASKEFFVGLMMTEELQLREPVARSEVRAATIALLNALAALTPVLLAEVLTRLVAQWCVEFSCSQGSNIHALIFSASGVALLGALGARRAAMALLPVSTHMLESMFLGVASVLCPKLIVWMLAF